MMESNCELISEYSDMFELKLEKFMGEYPQEFIQLVKRIHGSNIDLDFVEEFNFDVDPSQAEIMEMFSAPLRWYWCPELNDMEDKPTNKLEKQYWVSSKFEQYPGNFKTANTRLIPADRLAKHSPVKFIHLGNKVFVPIAMSREAMIGEVRKAQRFVLEFQDGMVTDFSLFHGQDTRGRNRRCVLPRFPDKSSDFISFASRCKELGCPFIFAPLAHYWSEL